MEVLANLNWALTLWEYNEVGCSMKNGNAYPKKPHTTSRKEQDGKKTNQTFGPCGRGTAGHKSQYADHAASGHAIQYAGSGPVISSISATLPRFVEY